MKITLEDFVVYCCIQQCSLHLLPASIYIAIYHLPESMRKQHYIWKWSLLTALKCVMATTRAHISRQHTLLTHSALRLASQSSKPNREAITVKTL